LKGVKLRLFKLGILSDNKTKTKGEGMKCVWHFFHNWSKWSNPVEGYSGNKRQVSACLDCNRVKTREFWDDQVSISVLNSEIDEAIKR